MLIGIRKDGYECLLKDLFSSNPISNELPRVVIDHVINNVRMWDGKPHVTDICIDTREAYLKYRYDYFDDLKSIIRTSFGSLRHASVLNGILSEVKLDSIDLSGSADNIDIRPNGDIFVCDFKFFSSYSVAKHFGIVNTKVSKTDEFGEKTYYKNGKEKTESIKSFTSPSNLYITLQLNIYRKLLSEVIVLPEMKKEIINDGGMIERNIERGKIFDGMEAFLFVTDGGTYMAKSRGIDEMSYLDKNIQEIQYIDSIITKKTQALVEAMKTDAVPPMCKDIYCMDNRYKCQNFCPVRDICEKIGGSLPDKPF